MRKSLQLSLTAMFAALHAVLYFISFGLWRNWGIYLASVEGIILGPKFGFSAAFLGCIIGRLVRPDAFWMFGIVAEPLSVLMAGFLAKAKWKPVLVAYAIMLSAYFVHPFGSSLPLWTILDVLLALFLLYPSAKFGKYLFENNVKHLSIYLVLVSFVCIATDSLVRIFLLVPCGLHGLFFKGFDELYFVFVGAALDSFVEDGLVVAVSLLVGAPLLLAISKFDFLKRKQSKTENGKSL